MKGWQSNTKQWKTKDKNNNKIPKSSYEATIISMRAKPSQSCQLIKFHLILSPGDQSSA